MGAHERSLTRVYSHVLFEVLRVREGFVANLACVPAQSFVRLGEMSLESVGRAELFTAHVTDARSLPRVYSLVENISV